MPVPCASLLEEGGRLRSGRGENAARSGATLVELCVAMLLLAIVFVGWVHMNNIQAVNKESLRYAAVEKAAGMLDAVDYQRLSSEGNDVDGTFIFVGSGGEVVWFANATTADPPETVFPVFDETIPVGYQCHVVENAVADSVSSKWGDSVWLVMDLFDGVGEIRSKVAPFASLRVFCGRIR